MIHSTTTLRRFARLVAFRLVAAVTLLSISVCLIISLATSTHFAALGVGAVLGYLGRIVHDWFAQDARSGKGLPVAGRDWPVMRAVAIPTAWRNGGGHVRYLDEETN